MTNRWKLLRASSSTDVAPLSTVCVVRYCLDYLSQLRFGRCSFRVRLPWLPVHVKLVPLWRVRGCVWESCDRDVNRKVGADITHLRRKTPAVGFLAGRGNLGAPPTNTTTHACSTATTSCPLSYHPKNILFILIVTREHFRKPITIKLMQVVNHVNHPILLLLWI